MRVDLARQMTESMPHTWLETGSERWRVYVFGITRISRDFFIQLALAGSRFCTVTVRIPWTPDEHAAAEEVMALLTDWLESDHISSQTFLESPLCAAYAS